MFNPFLAIGRFLSFDGLFDGAHKDKKMNDGLNMAFAPENIENSHDVFVSLFGELKIYTSHGILREADLKSPKISRLLTYLLISGKKAHSSLEIAQALWPDDSTNPAIVVAAAGLHCRSSFNFKYI